MDQLKPAIDFFKQYGFWVSIAVILLGAVGIWFKVTGDLVAESETRASAIRSDISRVKSVQSELSTHPNPTSHEQMEAMIDVREDEVLEAWTKVFENQKDILVWPEEELTEELLSHYRGKIPIEEYVDFPIAPEQALPTRLLQQYASYIENVLPSIAAIAKAEWTAKFGGSSGGGAMGGMSSYGAMDMSMSMDSSMDTRGTSPLAANRIGITGVEKGPLVRWSSSAQANLIKELFPWEGRRPNTLEVYYSQENLWILSQLLAIIADVNDGAKQPFEAQIREIKQLSMGSRVRFTAGRLSTPRGGVSMDGMGMGMDMGMGTDMDMSMSSDTSMMGMDSGMGGTVIEVDPADNRYVDDKREPITGAALRAAFDSDSAEDAKLKVAKRVPVMMSVQIDQRAIPELIAACGSAPLMVQVIQTRVFGAGTAAPSAGGSGGMGTDMDMDSGMDSGMSMESGMDMGMGSGMSSSGMSGGYSASTGTGGGNDKFPLDVTVEVYGLIHIYNPPQESKLGVDQITAETVIDGETMGDQVEKEKNEGNIAAPDAALPSPDSAEPIPTPPTPVPATTPPTDATPPAAGQPAATPPASPPASGQPAVTPPAEGQPAQAPPDAGSAAAPQPGEAAAAPQPAG